MVKIITSRLTSKPFMRYTSAALRHYGNTEASSSVRYFIFIWIDNCSCGSVNEIYPSVQTRAYY